MTERKQKILTRKQIAASLIAPSEWHHSVPSNVREMANEALRDKRRAAIGRNEDFGFFVVSLHRETNNFILDWTEK